MAYNLVFYVRNTWFIAITSGILQFGYVRFFGQLQGKEKILVGFEHRTVVWYESGSRQRCCQSRCAKLGS